MMTPTSKNILVNELKFHLISAQENGLIFSYDLDHSFDDQEETLVLHQKETDFSLSMTIEKQEEQRVITSFTLVDNKQLEDLSLALYDAGSLEITLQALDLLFMLADHEDVEEMLFLLEKQEAEQLSSFECFFDVPTRMGRLVSRILPTSTTDYDEFVEKTEILKEKIGHELWCRQREDHFLKMYMQRPVKGEAFSLNISPVEKVPFISKSNVIIFPARTPKVVLEEAV